MTYRLDPAKPMSEALRQVAFAELEIAHGALSTPPERHSGVHNARKCLKRLRSLLLLTRPGMPEPAFADLTDKLTTIARGLAAARDAHALIDAVDKLHRETGAGPGVGPIHSLRAWLEKRRHAAEQNLEKSAASDAMRGLLELRPAFAGSRFIQMTSAHSPRVCGFATAIPAKPFSMGSPATGMRIYMTGGRECSTIGGRCNCSRRAFHPSSPPEPKRRARCRKFSAMTTTFPC